MKDSETLLRGTTGVGAALAGAIASSHQQNDIASLISIAGAIAPDVAVHIHAMAKRRMLRLLPSFFAGVEAAAAAPVATAVKNEDDAEALFEAYRRMANSSEEFAAKALGRLAGLYIRNDYRVDQFFRAAGRVIEELGADEYHSLQQVVSAAGTNGQQSYSGAIDLSLNPPNNNIEGGGAQVFYKKGEMWHGLKSDQGNIEKTPGMVRVFYLLRSHGLAKDVSAIGTWGGTTLPSECMHLDFELVGSRLKEILDPRVA
jgi:hypothetical protein